MTPVPSILHDDLYGRRATVLKIDLLDMKDIIWSATVKDHCKRLYCTAIPRLEPDSAVMTSACRKGMWSISFGVIIALVACG